MPQPLPQILITPGSDESDCATSPGATSTCAEANTQKQGLKCRNSTPGTQAVEAAQTSKSPQYHKAKRLLQLLSSVLTGSWTSVRAITHKQTLAYTMLCMLFSMLASTGSAMHLALTDVLPYLQADQIAACHGALIQILCVTLISYILGPQAVLCNT